MIREFEEETGLHIEDWEEVVTIFNKVNDYEVTFFRAFGNVHAIQSKTEEEVWVYSARLLPNNVIPNLRWIIPLAIDDTGIVIPVRMEDRGES
jgi:8-oxo-dGTP diphosphatase